MLACINICMECNLLQSRVITPLYSNVQVNKCISQEYVHTCIQCISIDRNKSDNMANMLNLLELQMRLYDC